MPTRHTLCYNLDAIAPTRGSGPQKYYPKWPTSVFLMYFGQTTVASPVCCCVWMRCWGVFPHKDPLSNDLKSRDNVYINTAIELWDSGSVGSFGVCVCVCVCAMRSPNYPQEISTPIPFLRITCILTQLTHTIHEREESNQQRREKTHNTRQDTQEDKRHPRSP